jgi:tetratricopeptide (TPR) repeat protein
MKKIIIAISLTLFFIGCNSASKQTTNTNVSAQKSNDSSVVSSHSSGAEKSALTPQSKTSSNASSSESSPMARAVDVSQMTADIEKAEKSFRQNQKDEKARGKLAETYFARAFALTEAAQYRAALGDFRKGLKLNPNNADARAMHDRIIDIFQNSLHREPPNEGEEPTPLPFKK